MQWKVGRSQDHLTVERSDFLPLRVSSPANHEIVRYSFIRTKAYHKDALIIVGVYMLGIIITVKVANKKH